MSGDAIVSEHLEFFVRNQSGCAFAAIAARDPAKYEWHHDLIMELDPGLIAARVDAARADPAISTLSIVFPAVTSVDELALLLAALPCGPIYLHETLDTPKHRCYRFRAKVGEDESFVSGFGPFDFMPETRRTPYTSIVMRVKPRPVYDWYLKPPTEGLVHVADMDMKGIPDRRLQRLWNNTFLTVAGILGKKPDDESAAKTTFIIPLERAAHISL
ncbi:hypothetical protein [Sphingomonas sp.]|jgi:hypothetical protein|uniref:hypothetical protein n=1 Tax=Sphingomonas sp. TaxID=28214 RepID=UPI002E12133E|nr:hypothetical protein [Sphingomonas sp.]